MNTFQIPKLGAASIRLIEMAGRPGGVSAAEADADPGVDCSNVGDQLYQLFKRGHIARAKDGRFFRYFHTVQAAEAFECEKDPESKPVVDEPWQPYQPDESFTDELRRLRSRSAA